MATGRRGQPRGLRLVLLAGAWLVGMAAYLVLMVGGYFLLPADPLSPASIGRALVAELVVLSLFLAVFLLGLRRVPRAQAPMVRSLSLLVMVVVPFVLFFASVYLGLATGSSEQIPGLQTHLDALYFTVTMITTVGFGDIAPLGQEARAVATTQMVVNIVFLGLLVRTAVNAGRQAHEQRVREGLPVLHQTGLPGSGREWQAATDSETTRGEDES